MSRPVRYLIPATLLSISLVFTGCKSIYSDMYSPRRNHFIPVKEKPKADLAPVTSEAVPGAGSPDLLPPGLPPAAPPSAPVMPTDAPAMPVDEAAPMIPGL